MDKYQYTNESDDRFLKRVIDGNIHRPSCSLTIKYLACYCHAQDIMETLYRFARSIETIDMVNSTYKTFLGSYMELEQEHIDMIEDL